MKNLKIFSIQEILYSTVKGQSSTPRAVKQWRCLTGGDGFRQWFTLLPICQHCWDIHSVLSTRLQVSQGSGEVEWTCRVFSVYCQRFWSRAPVGYEVAMRALQSFCSAPFYRQRPVQALYYFQVAGPWDRFEKNDNITVVIMGWWCIFLCRISFLSSFFLREGNHQTIIFFGNKTAACTTI